MANRKSYTGFPVSHQPRFYATPDFLKMGIKYLNLSSFIQVSRIKDEKSAAKFHIKTVSGKVVAQSIAFRMVSIYWQGVAGRACIPHTSPHIARQPPNSITSLRSAHWLASDFHSWMNSWIDCQTNVYIVWLSTHQFNRRINSWTNCSSSCHIHTQTV